jgi:hypothetical protein
MSADNPSLIELVQQGAVERVQEYLAAGVDADSADSVGRGALWHAAFQGNVPIMELLIAYQANVNLDDDTGQLPLTAALEARQYDAAALLLKHDADINMVAGRQGQTPLHWAFNMDLKDEKTERVLWLLEKGADHSRVSGNNQTVLELARQREIQFPFASDILGHMEEYIRTHDPAYLRAQELRRTKEQITVAVHAGITAPVSAVRFRFRFKQQ